MEHLVYCDQKANVLSNLLNGSKTKIIRGAAGRKLPYGRVNIGEVLYFVENDGTQVIKAKGIVKSVYNSPPMTQDESIAFIKSEQKGLNLSVDQQKRWYGKKYVCIIEVEQVMLLDNVLIYDRKDNMDDWMIVYTIEDILVGSNKIYQNIKIND
ncbi:MAG: hypothetical protein RBT45_01240 [Acholeplasmataceae bacterium]|jgi:uncharacterized protein YacL (UPF0231 family)|nr:hypothetical protein [Acholeplasmataceae bacterium]